MNDPQHNTRMRSADNRALTVAGLLTGFYFLIELAIGLWTGSVSVLSDAFHTFSAVGGVLVAAVAGYFARQEATPTQTFGLVRAEIIGALFNGLFLVGMAGLVLWMGVMRLRHPIELATTPMLLVAVGGLITEVISLRLMWAGQKVNLNMKGAFWHVMQTFVGSLIIIVSALVIQFTGFLAVDPLLGMAFGLVLFWASWRIIRGALRILLDVAPEDLDLAAMQHAIESVPGVENVHHFHARTLTSGKNIVTAHVRITDLAESPRIQEHIRSVLAQDFGVYFSTIQTETTCLDEKRAKEIDFSGSA